MRRKSENRLLRSNHVKTHLTYLYKHSFKYKVWPCVQSFFRAPQTCLADLKKIQDFELREPGAGSGREVRTMGKGSVLSRKSRFGAQDGSNWSVGAHTLSVHAPSVLSEH